MSKADRSSTLHFLVATAVLSAMYCSAEAAGAAASASSAADSTPAAAAAEANSTIAGTDSAAVTAGSTAAVPDDAVADDASFAETRADEVVVSSRRREERAQDVPIPIAAITGADLAAAGQSRFEELNQRLPSTNIQFNNPRQTSIAVRGLGNNPANDALESSVGVYVDGVYLGRASMANLDLVDLSQVELLRGPAMDFFESPSAPPGRFAVRYSGMVSLVRADLTK